MFAAIAEARLTEEGVLDFENGYIDIGEMSSRVESLLRRRSINTDPVPRLAAVNIATRLQGMLRSWDNVLTGLNAAGEEPQPWERATRNQIESLLERVRAKMAEFAPRYSLSLTPPPWALLLSIWGEDLLTSKHITLWVANLNGFNSG